MVCKNCGTTYGCGCQKRVVNGKEGCSSCMGSTVKTIAHLPVKPKPPVINRAVWHR